MELICQSLEQLPSVAKEIITKYSNARVFALYGAMGAGKTTLINALCNHIGTIEKANSPSYAIINEYLTHNGHEVFHFDFYRIKNIEEVFDLGYEDYFYSGNYCFIEWPEKVENLLPPGHIKIQITDKNGIRVIHGPSL